MKCLIKKVKTSFLSCSTWDPIAKWLQSMYLPLRGVDLHTLPMWQLFRYQLRDLELPTSAQSGVYQLWQTIPKYLCSAMAWNGCRAFRTLPKWRTWRFLCTGMLHSYPAGLQSETSNIIAEHYSGVRLVINENQFASRSIAWAAAQISQQSFQPA